MLRPTPEDPWGVEQDLWNTGAKENQQLNPGGPSKAKFHIEPQWDRGTKVCSRGLGHNTKMAATPIYVKNPSQIFFSGTKGPMTLWLGI